MQTSSTQVKADYSFNVEKTGSTYTVTYKRAKYGIGILFSLLFPAMLVSFFIVMAMHGSLQGWIVLTIVMLAGTFLLLNLLRKDGRFSIAEKALIVGEREFDKAHVKNFFIKAPGGYEQTAETTRTSGGGFIYGGNRVSRIGTGAASATTGVIGGIAQAGGLMMRSSRKGIQKAHGKINYSVGFMYGEKEVRLATGLSEQTAEIMLDKVIDLSSPVV
ncbi:MAG: hypothetical protein INR73_17925 [Williamsia sp.]|nr:hypothetical protein [Williamsia sp.]